MPVNYSHLSYRNSLSRFSAIEREAIQRGREYDEAHVIRQAKSEAAANSEGGVIPPPAKDFYLGGKAIFTLEIPAEFAEQHKTKRQYTYRISKSEKTDKFPEAYFVSLLTGGDNQNDYSYIGKLDPNSGRVFTTAKSIIPQDSMPMKLLNRALLNVFSGTPELISAAGFCLHHEGRCSKCGRPLTDSESIRRGTGAICATKE